MHWQNGLTMDYSLKALAREMGWLDAVLLKLSPSSCEATRTHAGGLWANGIDHCVKCGRRLGTAIHNCGSAMARGQRCCPNCGGLNAGSE